jgi:hypothetical protein
MSDTGTIAPAAATTFEACKQAIFPILAAHGIARVTIDYNGEGDEGQVNDILAFDAAGEQVDLPTVDCERHQLGYDGTIASDVTDLASALDSFATEALCALYMGWEDNAGSCGELEILTEPRTVTLTHNWRIETFDTTVSEL